MKRIEIYNVSLVLWFKFSFSFIFSQGLTH